MERIKALGFEELELQKGSHAYLLKDEELSISQSPARNTQEQVAAMLESEAIFASKVRQKVESMGGVFNGIRTLDLNIIDPDRFGSTYPHRLTFALVDY